MLINDVGSDIAVKKIHKYFSHLDNIMNKLFKVLTNDVVLNVVFPR